MTREEEIRSRYEKELANLRKEQSECNHEWGDIEYNPEIKQMPRFEDRFIGSDYMPELVGYTESKVARWSRTCKKCGKVEYTKELKAVKHEPKFED